MERFDLTLSGTHIGASSSLREKVCRAKLKLQLEGLEQWRDVLAAMNDTIDQIDLAMASCIKDAQSVALELTRRKRLLTSWRPFLGKQQRHSKTEIFQHIAATHNQEPALSELLGNLTDSLQSIERDREILEKRMEQTSQELASVIAILESKTATAQTKTISVLTELAFIFIPLSFASSFFSMSIKVL